MAGLTGEQKAEVELMIAAALTKQEGEIGAKLNMIIAHAESKCTERQADMDRSKELHETEMRGLGEAEARGSALVVQQNALSDSCKSLAESLESRFARTGAVTKDLERRASSVVAEQQTGIKTILAGFEAKLQVSFAVQEEQNVKVHQQLEQAEKMMKEIRNAAANNGGAGILRGREVCRGDCNVEKLKETTDVEDYRKRVHTLELCFEAHYDSEFAGLVVRTIRHEKKPIAADTFPEMIDKINQE